MKTPLALIQNKLKMSCPQSSSSSSSLAGSAKHLITIFGATGNQGGAVARSLLANKSDVFSVRGLTRNAAGEKAKALAALGAEMVGVDAVDGTEEELVAAMGGSWGVFVNVNGDDEAIDELELGKKIVGAAAKAGSKHLIYSGMASASETTGGSVPVKAFDDKNAVPGFAASLPFTNVVNVSPGWYMENFLVPDMAKLFGGFPYSLPEPPFPPSEDTMLFSCPAWGGEGNLVPFISITTDYGDIVHGAFLSCLASGDEKAGKHHGQLVQGLSTSVGIPEVLDKFTQATAKKAEFAPIPVEAMQTFGIKGLETVKGMFSFTQASGGLYYGTRNDVKPAEELKRKAVEASGGEGGELMSWETFWGMHFGREA